MSMGGITLVSRGKEESSIDEGDVPVWEYTPEESVRISRINFGHHVNKDGYLIPYEQPSGEVIAKAKLVLTELFAFLDRLDIEIVADSEQNVVAIHIESVGSGSAWTADYSDRHNAVIAFNGYRAGTLKLME